MTDLILEKTAFNVQHWAQFSRAELLAEGQGFFNNFSDEDRVTLLNILYDLLHDVTSDV
jgi:hypothetical protein